MGAKNSVQILLFAKGNIADCCCLEKAEYYHEIQSFLIVNYYEYDYSVISWYVCLNYYISIIFQIFFVHL